MKKKKKKVARKERVIFYRKRAKCLDMAGMKVVLEGEREGREEKKKKKGRGEKDEEWRG